MAPTDLNFTPLAADAVVPTTGHNYQVVNVGYKHWLDNAFSDLADGNSILSWYQNSPETQNQIWKFLTYPSSDGSTVFTLQALSTVQSNSSSVIGGRGGYMRVDPATNKIVHGGQPQAWKLIEAGPSMYKISPFESVFSNNGKLVITDVNSAIKSPAENQAQLQQDSSAPQQLWTFN